MYKPQNQLYLCYFILLLFSFCIARLQSIIYVYADYMQATDSIPLAMERVYGLSTFVYDSNKLLAPWIIAGLREVLNLKITSAWELFRFLSTFLAGAMTFKFLRFHLQTQSAFLGALLSIAFMPLVYTIALRDHPTDSLDLFFVSLILWILRGGFTTKSFFLSLIAISLFSLNRALSPMLGIGIFVLFLIESKGQNLFDIIKKNAVPIFTLIGTGYIVQLAAKVYAQINTSGSANLFARVQNQLYFDQYFTKTMWLERRKLDLDSLVNYWNTFSKIQSDMPLAQELATLKNSVVAITSIEEKRLWLRENSIFSDGGTVLFIFGFSLIVVVFSFLNGNSKAQAFGLTGLFCILMTQFGGGYLDEGRQVLWTLPFSLVCLGLLLDQQKRQKE